jgi:hypothetical protein
VEIYKGDLVGNLYESLVSAGYQLGYYNRAKELLTPESHYGVSMLRCTYHASKKGGHTHCPLSTFQFLKFDGEMMHVYTQCSKGISNSAKTNPDTNRTNNPINNAQVSFPILSPFMSPIARATLWCCIGF